ncbi:uncharacterized protein LOC107991877 [Cucumis melo]|uniref:Uncharacterized protein LOC107991877 n=1 Tax=Cucumis melo TaxID=3656 RepID=A0ABM3KD16_CUCME|nr:uncharacterized protein LOC107991877 [Cucumis melo]
MDDETITKFNVRVLDIANESNALGEKMSDSKLVRKVLRSLLSKFNMKVTTIEEANDLSTMKLDELFRSLRTFELHLGEDTIRKKFGLALTSVKEESTEDHKVSLNNDSLVIRGIADKYRRKDHERSEKDYGPSKFEKNDKGIRCHECEGFGHIQTKCATYLKRKKKSLVATFSNEEDYSESDEEEVGMALISIINENKEEVENVNAQTIDQQESVSDDSLNESALKRKWKHRTENAAFFSKLRERNVGSLVFGDGGKGRIGLSANLISISQLCDQGYHVSFSKDRCNVVDNQNKIFLSGTRLSDNYYHWDSKVSICNLSKVEEASLWHKRLGHISGSSIAKAIKAEALQDFPPSLSNHKNAAHTALLGN